MKNSMLHAALLGIVASASFSLTQAASLAATAGYPAATAASNKCTPVVNPVKPTAQNADPATDGDPAQDKLFVGGE